MYEDDLEYAGKRLKKTIIQYKGEAVLIHNVHANGTATVSTSDNGHEEIDLKDLDSELTHLGYTQVDGRGPWVWLYRIPLRNEWRQGHSPKNIRYIRNGEEERMFEEFNPITFNIPHQRRYLSKEDAINRGGAFSRNFCIQKNILYYKGVRVGLVDKVIQLDPQYKYLARRLEKS